jgi:hypothetical protein
MDCATEATLHVIFGTFFRSVPNESNAITDM